MQHRTNRRPARQMWMAEVFERHQRQVAQIEKTYKRRKRARFCSFLAFFFVVLFGPAAHPELAAKLILLGETQTRTVRKDDIK